MDTYRVRARNLAADSANKMHDDEVARQYGFAGGLVPGADVFAYMAHVPASTWGERWLAAGTMAACFVHPVYDSEDVVVAATRADDRTLDLELRSSRQDPAGVLCATGRATLPDPPASVPAPAGWPSTPPPRERHPARPDVVGSLDRLGDWDVVVDAEKGRRYLDAIGESAPVFARGAVAHPGWLIRCANRVLAINVDLGPWIHTASELHNHAVVRAGQLLSTRARLSTEYERKGHRFVELDMAVVAGGAVAATIQHTAIYLPRRG